MFELMTIIFPPDQAHDQPPSSKRLVAYDLLKIVGALGVVLFHIKVPGSTFWYTGLFIFVFFIGYTPGRHRAFKEHVFLRARRLLVPWIIWCVAYWAADLARGTGWFFNRPLDVNYLLVGPEIHLWFLPFAFLSSVLLFFLRDLKQANSTTHFLIIGAAMIISFYVVMSMELEPPTAQWIVATPALIAGFGASLFKSDRMMILMLLASTAIAATAYLAFEVNGALQTAIAILLCAVAATWRSHEIPALKYFADLTLGVYLMHPALIFVFGKVIPGADKNSYSFGISVFFAALLLTWMFKRNRFLRICV